jgi:hypothetical protein
MTLDRTQVRRDLRVLSGGRKRTPPVRWRFVAVMSVVVLLAASAMALAVIFVPEVYLWGAMIPAWAFFCWNERNVPLRRSGPTLLMLVISILMFAENV